MRMSGNILLWRAMRAPAFFLVFFLCSVPLSRAQAEAEPAKGQDGIAGVKAEADPGGYIDVHIHLDGVGRPGGPQGRPREGMMGMGVGPGMRGRPGMERMRQRMQRRQEETSDGSDAAAYLISLMDRYGVEKAIVMPPPQNPGQAGGYTYTALLDVVSRYHERLVLGAGGGTLNPMIQGTLPGDVTDEVRKTFASKAEEIVKAGARVFGEMTVLHTCMNPRHHYVAAPADHPLYLLLADLAARYDIPIDLHMEALAGDMRTPEKLLDACDKNPSTLPATIPGFERLLDHNPNARIVWQHIGWDNTGQMTPGLLRRLLGKHPNLYLAIKAVPETARPNRLHDDQYRILPEWLALFEEFPDRVVTGADEFARAEGQTGGYKKPPFFEITWKMIAGLPPGLREKIGRTNAARIYRLSSVNKS